MGLPAAIPQSSALKDIKAKKNAQASLDIFFSLYVLFVSHIDLKSNQILEFLENLIQVFMPE
jgi:hypothetical protein